MTAVALLLAIAFWVACVVWNDHRKAEREAAKRRHPCNRPVSPEEAERRAAQAAESIDIEWKYWHETH